MQKEEDELFLARASNREPCCVPNTPGVEWAHGVEDVMDIQADTVVNKSLGLPPQAGPETTQRPPL